MAQVLLDEAATVLGVERRRIYDILNVLAAVRVVSVSSMNYGCQRTIFLSPSLHSSPQCHGPHPLPRQLECVLSVCAGFPLPLILGFAIYQGSSCFCVRS